MTLVAAHEICLVPSRREVRCQGIKEERVCHPQQIYLQKCNLSIQRAPRDASTELFCHPCVTFGCRLFHARVHTQMASASRIRASFVGHPTVPAPRTPDARNSPSPAAMLRFTKGSRVVGHACR